MVIAADTDDVSSSYSFTSLATIIKNMGSGKKLRKIGIRIGMKNCEEFKYLGPVVSKQSNCEKKY